MSLCQLHSTPICAPGLTKHTHASSSPIVNFFMIKFFPWCSWIKGHIKWTAPPYMIWGEGGGGSEIPPSFFPTIFHNVSLPLVCSSDQNFSSIYTLAAFFGQICLLLGVTEVKVFRKKSYHSNWVVFIVYIKTKYQTKQTIHSCSLQLPYNWEHIL